MRTYDVLNQGEMETYAEYVDRKQLDWKERLRDICIEVKDSSMKDEDKERFIVKLATKLLNNNLSHNNWKE